MTGYNLTLSPDELLARGAKLVESSPQPQRLVTALRRPLLEAAKQVAASMATDQLGGLAGQLANYGAQSRRKGWERPAPGRLPGRPRRGCPRGSGVGNTACPRA